MTDNEVIQMLADETELIGSMTEVCLDEIEGLKLHMAMKNALFLIGKLNSEIEKWKKNCDELYEQMCERQKAEVDIARRMGKVETVREYAEKVDKLLNRYSHLHKQADEARQTTEEYADGTPMEMVSVWEVLSLKKWELVDYETMNTLQDNIETIAKERLLLEFEKDFRLLTKEMVGDTDAE